jgi:dTDP-4-dehydrorhamnose 3,5-epimerase
MKVTPTELPGVLLLSPQVFGDSRGHFFEPYNARRFADIGIHDNFVQDNVSSSRRGVLRGLHLQHPHGQAKLVHVLIGTIYDVVVDVRRGSPHFGRWHAVTLRADENQLLYVPAGFAHGFCVTSDAALFAYKVTDFYSPADELTVLWNDPDLDIPWPDDAPVLSNKDMAGLRLRDIPESRLPAFA